MTTLGEIRVARVVREVRQFLERWPNAGVVGVSGGADSVALLRALAACGVPFTVAHVNHKLRGADSDADETFVRDLCASFHFECRVKSVNVAELGGNLEATARAVRYAFFADVAKEVNASWIATAHTADDQAETVLHRLIRGTGLQGLRGIASWRAGGVSPLIDSQPHSRSQPIKGLTPPARPVIRPLLTLTRAEVLAYLAALNQPFREDASNVDPRYTRNRIRHELLPLLKTFNPDVVSSLAHLAEHASEAHEVLTALAGELLSKAERPPTANAFILDAQVLSAAPRAVLRVALRLLWERAGWPMGAMSFDAWERAVEIAGGNAPACDFPDGVSMRRAGRVVQVVRKE